MDTPLIKQYKGIKNRFIKYVLLFRLGDFYELFFEDAQECASILGIVLTKRGEVPMCGFQYNMSELYIQKLINADKKIAICEQIGEVDSKGKSLVERDVVRIVTKSTYFDETSRDNNFICAVIDKGRSSILCYADTSTNECFYEEVCNEFLISSLYRIGVVEIVLGRSNQKIEQIFPDITQIICCDTGILEKIVEDNEVNLAIRLLKNYLRSNLIIFSFDRIKKIYSNYMTIDENTIRNLEIINLNQGGKKNQSLLEILDKTQTFMGRRLLKERVLRPLIDKTEINERLDCVEFFINQINGGKTLKIKCCDLNKTSTHIRNPQDMKKLGESIENCYSFFKLFERLPDYLERKRIKMIPIKISAHLLEMLNENPGNLGEGTVFKKNYLKSINEEYVEICKKIVILGEKYNLKIKHNNLIGYFFETTNQKSVPDDFILKQGLVNCSRYSNKELIELEHILNNTKRRLMEEEQNLFNSLLEEIKIEKDNIFQLSNCIAEFDFFISLAKTAITNKYYRPTIVDSMSLKIKDGRHPVVEKNIANFVKNKTDLDPEKRGVLLTGPNMGGKSTYLRQNALIVLMVQIGSFVPGVITTSIWEGLFVRMGAGDNINENQSTFMMEMLECSKILSLAKEKSLVILDEIGRGTSTIDGMSLSFSIIEHLHDIIRCFFIISTHYNELSICSDYLKGLRNYRAAITEEEKKIFLLHNIEEGISQNSFGIEIAEKAGLPPSVIERGREFLDKMQISIQTKDLFS